MRDGAGRDGAVMDVVVRDVAARGEAGHGAGKERSGPGAACRAGVRRRVGLAGAALAAALFAFPPAPALADDDRPRGAVGALLGGSIFPFARSFPPPTPRCRALARELRSRHNSGRLNVWDLQRLRRAGCGGAT